MLRIKLKPFQIIAPPPTYIQIMFSLFVLANVKEVAFITMKHTLYRLLFIIIILSLFLKGEYRKYDGKRLNHFHIILLLLRIIVFIDFNSGPFNPLSVFRKDYDGKHA